MECEKVIDILQKQAAETYALEWDNVGLLVGSRDKEVKKIYIALDATDEAIKEAIEQGADMLLTHHPLIFRGIKRVTQDDFIGRRVMELVRADISYYAMHTNFDVMGMAEISAEKMGLADAVPLEETCVEAGASQGIGRVGSFAKQMTLGECAACVKSAFGVERVKVFGDFEKKVKRAAICPGSGGSDVKYALLAGADVYITGDIDHHTGIDAVAQGMAVIDAGHYGVEQIFIEFMADYIRRHIPGVEAVAQGRVEPFYYV